MPSKILLIFLAFAALSSSEAIGVVPSAVSGAPGLAKAAAAASSSADAAPGGGRILRLRGGHHEGYTLGVRDSIMIAHAFLDKEFGPAQGMHGATYTVDLEVHVDEVVTKLNWVVDIGVLLNILKQVLGKYNYKNLNELFPGINTTTEFMSKKIHEGVEEELAKHGVQGSMSVKLHESHNAWATYTNKIGAS